MQREMTMRLLVAAVSLVPWAAARATPPFYDPGAYCHQAARFAGTERTYAPCYREEQAAYDRIKLYWDGVPVRSRAYCGGMAESAGSSYQVLETCLQDQGAIAKGQGNRPSRP
jgi:hypothetical protein